MTELLHAHRTEASAAALCIGIVIDPPGPTAWQARLLTRLAALPGITAVLLVGSSAAPDRLGWRHLVRRCPGLQPAAGTLSCRPAGDLAGHDLLIDLTAGRTVRPANAARIWRLVTGDGQSLAGTFPFAADYGQAGHTAAIYLTEQRRGLPPVSLRAAHLGTWQNRYPALLDQAFELAILLCVQVLTPGGVDRAGAPDPTDPPPVRYGLPRLPGLRLMRRQAAARLRSIATGESWAVGIVDCPISAFLTGTPQRNAVWLPPPAGRSMADPFGRPDRDDLFWYEDFAPFEPGRIRQGRVPGSHAGTGPGDNPPDRAAVGIPLPGHLSYPYFFHHDGQDFVLPESHHAGRQVIFAFDRATGGLTPVAEPAPGRRLVDATLFAWDGRLWLAASDADHDAMADLSLWYADSPTGPWRPHAGNPVKLDVRSARSGGTPFQHQGALFRPAQDCSSSYGGAVVINRVLTLTPGQFREEPVALVRPDPNGPYPDGLHTLSAWGNRTLIDGKRSATNPALVMAKVRRRLRRPATPPAAIAQPLAGVTAGQPE